MSSTDLPVEGHDQPADPAATLRSQIAETVKKSQELLLQTQQTQEQLKKTSAEIDAQNLKPRE